MVRVAYIIFTFLLLIGASSMTMNQEKLKLKRVKITEGISAKLPVDFIPMSEEDLAVKYPSTKKPTAMYSSGDRLADFGLNVTKSNWAGGNLKVLKDIYKSTLFTLYSEVKILREEIVQYRNTDFVILEFTSFADGTRSYTFLMYTVQKNKVYIFNFTSPEKTMHKWQPIATEIMESVKIKAKKLENFHYDPTLNTTRKGKSIKDIMQENKKKPAIKNK